MTPAEDLGHLRSHQLFAGLNELRWFEWLRVRVCLGTAWQEKRREEEEEEGVGNGKRTGGKEEGVSGHAQDRRL